MPFADYTKGEIVARGKEIYQKQIKPLVEPQEKGKFVVIDILSGDYDVAPEHPAASKWLRERRPDSVYCAGRAGFPTAYRGRQELWIWTTGAKDQPKDTPKSRK